MCMRTLKAEHDDDTLACHIACLDGTASGLKVSSARSRICECNDLTVHRSFLSCVYHVLSI